MTELSPAAQAVMSAAIEVAESLDAVAIAAAALRAAANQMAAWADEDGRIDLGDILAIAAEAYDHTLAQRLHKALSSEETTIAKHY